MDFVDTTFQNRKAISWNTSLLFFDSTGTVNWYLAYNIALKIDNWGGQWTLLHTIESVSLLSSFNQYWFWSLSK